MDAGPVKSEINDKPRKIRLSLEEWADLAKDGAAIPITTYLRWMSMEPLIRINRDPVTFMPLSREPIPGDVVLLKRKDGAYVCHRVYKILDEGNTILTWGDNAEQPDEPIPRSSVVGIAVSYERDGKRITLDSDEQRRKGLEWLESKWKRPAFVAYRKLRHMVGDAVRGKGLK